MFAKLIFFLPFVGSVFAQDGQQLFTLYCSACHGVDGKGATGGTFPPLAGSPWLAGDANRAAKITLKGLTGPVDVLGRTYNLEMPPQGSTIPDEQLAAILTYTRSSWGNRDEAVSTEFVAAARAAVEDRKTPWTAEEILKLHPLPAVPPPIANLISRVYKGEWKELPDFSKLQATAVEEEHDGKLSLRRVGIANHYGVIWQGEITAPENGDFTFRLDVDDGARILVDDKEIVRVDGIGAMDGSRIQQGTVKLTAGVHKLRAEYFEFEGEQGISAAWRGPGIPGWKNLSDAPSRGRGGPPRTPIPLSPGAGHTTIYRNFIAGTTSRAIGFGFPGGVNLTYSADNLAPELIWTGAFMDASRHWIERGQGSQPPAGDRIVNPSGSRALPKEARFRGFKLDPAGNPTFSVQIGTQYLLDGWKPAGSETSAAFARTLAVNGEGDAIELLLVDKLPVTRSGDREYDLGGKLAISFDATAPELRDGKLYLKLTPGQTSTLTYSWK